MGKINGNGGTIYLEKDSIIITDKTYDLTVASGDTIRIDSKNQKWGKIVADGGMIIAAGLLQIQSLKLLNGATLTHKEPDNSGSLGLLLVIDSLLFIDGASCIDVTGKGYPGAYDTLCAKTSGFICGATGMSGGSYGGLGGSINGSSPPVYGDAYHPNDFGSGGARDALIHDSYGGPGGGFLSIVVPELVNNGKILSNGASGRHGGGGSGGAIAINTDTMSGNGLIMASGGLGFGGGGGGGGRIALFSCMVTNAQLGNISAGYGSGNVSGQGGSIYIQSRDTVINDTNSAFIFIVDGAVIDSLNVEFDGAHLVLDNVSATIDGTHVFKSLHLRNGARLQHLPTDTTNVHRMSIHAQEIISIDATSIIDVCGLGYTACRTNGNQRSPDTSLHTGGSHGGRGGYQVEEIMDGNIYLGPKITGQIPTPRYDDILWPTQPGGGANDTLVEFERGMFSGGGVVHLKAPIVLVDGQIRADGGILYSTYHDRPTAAGGSIIIEAYSILGQGLVTANGGETGIGSSGAGGCIFIDADTCIPTIEFPRQGMEWYPIDSVIGTSGSLIFKNPRCYRDVKFVFDYDLDTNRIDASDSTFDGYNIIVKNTYKKPQGCLTINGEHRFKSLVLDHSVLTHDMPVVSTDTIHKGMKLIVADSIVIDAYSSIDVTGKGYRGARDTLCALTYGGICGSTGTSGGGYGGLGGAFIGISNAIYGDEQWPNKLGSGGSRDTLIDSSYGGAGGGYVEIATPKLRNSGTIISNGESGFYGGGGSGGSILITTDTLIMQEIRDTLIRGRLFHDTLAGKIIADGGFRGFKGSGGGGGGGRIALLNVDSMHMDMAQCCARGGLGNAIGDPGTIYIEHFDTTIQNTGTYGLFNLTGTIDSSDMVLDSTILTIEKSSIGFKGRHFFNELSINGGEIISDATLESQQLSLNGRLIVSDTLLADYVYIGNAGTISTSLPVVVNDTPKVGKICIVANSIEMRRGSINANSLGYPSGYTYNGVVSLTDSLLCGSHGGHGMYWGSNTDSAGPIYGSFREPSLPGSGGGIAGKGGYGGGVIRIICNQLNMDVESSITADGDSCLLRCTFSGWYFLFHAYGAGGAGGSIWITADSPL